MSPTGDYLATTHVGEVGVFLWANRLLYERVFLKPIDRNTVQVPRLSKYTKNIITCKIITSKMPIFYYSTNKTDEKAIDSEESSKLINVFFFRIT